jgi:hypothetical protein
LAWAGCSPKTDTPAEPAEPAEPEPKTEEPAAATLPEGSPTQVFWGDTHLHTSYSPDAYLLENRSADPDTAYQYAKGYPVIHPYHRSRIQIETPLDFLVVSDHGEFMGVLPKLLRGDPIVANTPTGKRYRKMAESGNEIGVFADLIAQVNKVKPPSPDLDNPEINKTVWAEIMAAADRHNDPGKFTAFMGWEWTSTPQGANLHRVVVMKGGQENRETFIPYTSLDSDRPEDLWAWLNETTEKANTDFLAIPHNSNISKGLMFPLADSDGKIIDEDHAKLRMRWEPVVEVTQIKGDSETHPKLSPTDEFADYETYDHLIEVEGTKVKPMLTDAFLGQLTDEDRRGTRVRRSSTRCDGARSTRRPGPESSFASSAGTTSQTPTRKVTSRPRATRRGSLEAGVLLCARDPDSYASDVVVRRDCVGPRSQRDRKPSDDPRAGLQLTDLVHAVASSAPQTVLSPKLGRD